MKGPENDTLNIDYKIDTAQQNLTYTIPQINPNSTMGVYANWTYSSAGTFNGVVTVDYPDIIFETDETNNELPFSITVSALTGSILKTIEGI